MHQISDEQLTEMEECLRDLPQRTPALRLREIVGAIRAASEPKSEPEGDTVDGDPFAAADNTA